MVDSSLTTVSWQVPSGWNFQINSTNFRPLRLFICFIRIIYIVCFMYIILIIFLSCRQLDLFKSVFPYRNVANRLIMDTEKARSIKHCHVDVMNYAIPMNCCCDAPEGGHKTWVHGQGRSQTLRTNQDPSSAKTMMTPSLNKETSQLLSRVLCDAM